MNWGFLDQVQAAGGGIHVTTEKTREATESELLTDFLKVIPVDGF